METTAWTSSKRPLEHAVQFYAAPAALADSVAAYVEAGLASDECAIVIATRENRELIASTLAARGAAAALADGRVLILDARETLAAFMIDDVPDATRFAATIENAIARLPRRVPAFRAYGEMVDVLWRAGNHTAAARLEQLWAELQRRQPFRLLCAYAIGGIGSHRGVTTICDLHDRVLATGMAAQTDVQVLIDEIVRRTQTEAELRDFLETAVVPIHRVDQHGIIRWANAAELALLGYAAHEYVGRHIAEFHVDAPVIADLLARVLGGEEVHDQPARLRAKDGSIRHVVISSNLHRRDGTLTTRCFTRDVTAQVRAEQEREEANRAKDEFLAMLGHELRNPLSPILAAVQLMRARGDGATREQDIIERQVRHLTRIVADLLDVSRIARGTIELDLRCVQLRAIVASAVEIVSAQYAEREHALEVDAPAGGCWVMCDETRLVQVVVNLLTNAARYTPRGGRIQVRVVDHGDRVRLHVADNGSGIDRDLLPRIFQLFVQGRRQPEKSQGGLGVGLALVANLVRLHGGGVTAHSDGPGRGTEVIVELPAAPAGAQPEQPRPHAERVTARRARKILVVDDNEDAGLLLADILRAAGHEVALCADAHHALAMLDATAPDVALLDIDLPGMDGYELARTIRARRGAAIWLVAITGYGQERDRERALAAGFDAHLVKPVASARILAAIDGA